MPRSRKPYDCGLGPAFEVVGGKWKSSLLWSIRTKPRRFGELKRLTPGISEKMLMQQLREMQAHGLIERRDFREVPPRVEYSITRLGVSLDDALIPLARWGERHSRSARRKRSAS